MKFSEIVEQASDLLERKGRVSYRALKREFDLDDSALDDLKDELIDIQELAVDKDGRMLVWAGGSGSTETLPESKHQTPVSYTPPHLAERILAEQAAMEARGAVDGERKTITALFADLKGSTALIERLDPEDARAIVDPALQIMMNAVHRYDGYVAQALGDGIFALFGAPIAHEDHAQRALYAALAMQQEMRRHGDELRRDGRAPLQIRVGVNTGEVVLRSIRKDDLNTDYVPVGHSTNIAARMEQLAAPGAILVTAQTFRLTDGYFDFEALGETPIKGLEQPLAIYELRGVGQLRTRLEVAERRGLTHFVGRQSEIGQLRRAYAEARDGHGQIVGVVGDPGLGKSRLFYEFKRSADHDCLLLEAFSISHAKASPYVPVIELLHAYFGIDTKDDERRRREKVTGKVLALDRKLEETLPYLFALLVIGAVSSDIQQMEPQLRRARTVAAVKQLLLRESLDQPLIVIFEDLHWIDAETQALLDALAEGLAAARVLLLVNYRSEYRHEWGVRTYYTQLRLTPLGKADAAALLGFLMGEDASLAVLKTLIVERTEGTPFYMEEVVQTLVEERALSGDRGSYRLAQATEALHIPDSVRAVLAARIDRLDTHEKQVLQHLAVIGREFPLGLVCAVVAGSETDLHSILASLQAREFLYEQPAFPEVEYVFKHALTQEVAYGSLLQTHRRALHERTAQAIETLHADSLEDHWSELAHHYAHSDNDSKAVIYLHLAGGQAVRRAAYGQAQDFFARALELLLTLPNSPAHARQELAIHTELGSVLLNTEGYAATTVQHHYERAITLCEETGTSGELLPALAGLFLVYFLRGDHERAQVLADRALDAAHRTQASSDLLTAQYMLGQSLLALGEFVRARQAQRSVGERYVPAEHHVLAARYGEDPGAVSLGFESVTLFALGFPDQALQRAQEANALAQTIEHDATLAQTLFWSSLVRLERREYAEMRREIERALDVGLRYSLQFIIAFATPIHGAGLVEQGDVVAGIARIRKGVGAYHAMNARFMVPFYLSLLARAEAAGGDVPAALTLIDEALADAVSRRELQHEAELHRFKGELVLQSAHIDASARTEVATASFQRALDIARHQQAKSWELRAATSLARLLLGQDRATEAYALLAPVYDWFTEGFDTNDLRDAKALLEELG